MRKDKLKVNDTCVTFDDNLLCQYDVALPVLKERGLTAFWFVYTSPLVGKIEKIEVYSHFRFSMFKDIETFYEEFFCLALEKAQELGVNIEGALNAYNPDNHYIGFDFYTPNDKRFRYLRDDILGKEKYEYLMDSMIEKYQYSVSESAHKLWMNKVEIQQLSSSGHIIGLHSHSHPTILAKFDYNSQYEEYSKNKEVLESIIPSSITTVSYPCNAYNNDTAAIMKKLHIDIGFMANMNHYLGGKLQLIRKDHANIMREMRNKYM